MSAHSLLLVLLVYAVHIRCQSIAQLQGTWSTKSRSVTTGPDFYDLANDELLEPKLPGISYSFTDTGYYEEAYYRAIANPQNPACPQGIMQWQHGTFNLNPNGSLTLTPYAQDGRQLLSEPCMYDQGIYTRYNQSEYFKSFSVYVDRYHEVDRLDLYSWDGAPMNPMYLVDRSPMMLPTTVLSSTPSDTARAKRHYVAETGAFITMKNLFKAQDLANPDRWWWLGVAMTSLGGIALLCS